MVQYPDHKEQNGANRRAKEVMDTHTKLTASNYRDVVKEVEAFYGEAFAVLRAGSTAACSVPKGFCDQRGN